ncbi:MAG: transcriptional regulator [Candidatus Micrarchaeota archaeon]
MEGNGRNHLGLISESKSLNSEVFSLARLLLLDSLVAVELDGASFRELKAALDLTDGALYANLQALVKMGYLTEHVETYEGKEQALYKITNAGKEEWKKVKNWLFKLSSEGGG